MRVVQVELVKDTSQDTTGFCNSRALGMIRRLPVEQESEIDDVSRHDNWVSKTRQAGAQTRRPLVCMECRSRSSA